ncbi:hypothetical protein N9J26_00675 [bacterium]|nr:hypothetical protein [bacterium]
MIIDNTNYHVGYKAMASILLLYYHLLDEGGVTNDQTFYIDPNDFDAYSLLGVEIKESDNESLDIDEALINEGAAIFLLCDLNDMIGEYSDDYHGQSLTKKILEALQQHEHSLFPEVSELLKLVMVNESDFNFQCYNKILQAVYKKYVRGFFVRKLS